MGIEEMLVYDGMDDEVYSDVLTRELLEEIKELGIDMDEIINDKRRIQLKSFYKFNDLITTWHQEQRHSIIDMVVALSNYSYNISDVLSMLSNENLLYLRESLATKYGKKIAVVTDMSDFFE